MRALKISFISSATGLLCYLLAEHEFRNLSPDSIRLVDKLGAMLSFFSNPDRSAAEAEMMPGTSFYLDEQRVLMLLTVLSLMAGITALVSALLVFRSGQKRNLSTRAIVLALVAIFAPLYLFYNS